MLQHTTNNTTVQVGQCVATLISYIENTDSDTIAYTFELVYPRIIHSEFMTHRMFSRNAMSSRATPLKTMVESLDEEHYVPKEFLKNQSGMVGGEPLSEEDQKLAKGYWQTAYENARDVALGLHMVGAHKQYVNRLLEPFAFIKVIVTATEWDNFFKLRLAPDAQPEIQDLAKAIKESMSLRGKLEKGKDALLNEETNLPYVTQEDVEAVLSIGSSLTAKDIGTAISAISMARCARVSYYKHDGTKPSILDDIKLARRLVSSGHLTPSEHVAFLDDNYRLQKNLKGFTTLRDNIEKAHKYMLQLLDDLLCKVENK